MILTIVIFLIITLVTWLIIRASYNPLGHLLNSGANNDEAMHEGELRKILETADGLYQSRNWLAAERAYLRVLKLDHGNIFAFRRLALIYTYLKNYEDAAECLELVLKSDQTAADFQNYATILHHAKKLPEAIEAMRRSLSLQPTVERAVSLARLSGEAKDRASQHEALRTAVEIDPNNQEARHMLAAWQGTAQSSKIEK